LNSQLAYNGSSLTVVRKIFGIPEMIQGFVRKDYNTRFFYF